MSSDDGLTGKQSIAARFTERVSTSVASFYKRMPSTVTLHASHRPSKYDMIMRKCLAIANGSRISNEHKQHY